MRHYVGKISTVGCLLAVAILPGCGKSETPAPQTAVSVPDEPASSQSDVSAPKVAAPVDTSGFEADPCKVVTPGQFASFGMGIQQAKIDNAPDVGPGCDWMIAGNSAGGGFSGTFQTGNSDGISGIYKQGKSGELGFFEERPAIDGHPVVAYDRTDGRTSGSCGIAIGLRDDLAYTVGIQAGPKNPFRADPCAGGEKMARSALETLKGSS